MNPPSDHPKTLKRLNSRALITRPVSSASWAILKGAPLSVESPMPRLSRRTISLTDASRSMKEGSQSALVAAKPLRTSSGRPLPRRRQAIRPPSTGIVAIGSLAIGDHRKPRGERQVPRVRGYQAEAWGRWIERSELDARIRPRNHDYSASPGGAVDPP